LAHIGREKEKPVDAVPTCLEPWNVCCRGAGGGVGIARGWVAIVAGNTGQGKSLVALNNVAEAVRHGEKVCFISLEMSQEELTTRLAAMVAGGSVRRLEQGDTFSPEDWQTASLQLKYWRDKTGAHVYVNRDPLYKLADITDAMRYHYLAHECRFFVVDYMQLAYVAGQGDNLLSAITEVSHAVRQTTKELGVATLALSQYNRQTSANYADSPIVQGLMGGSPLENDSDQVLLLDHSRYERPADGTTAYTIAILGKNRHGPTGSIPVRWDYRNLKLYHDTKAEDYFRNEND